MASRSSNRSLRWQGLPWRTGLIRHRLWRHSEMPLPWLRRGGIPRRPRTSASRQTERRSGQSLGVREVDADRVGPRVVHRVVPGECAKPLHGGRPGARSIKKASWRCQEGWRGRPVCPGSFHGIQAADSRLHGPRGDPARKIVEGIRRAQLAGGDQAHEQVPHVGTVRSLVEQGIPPVPERLLDCALIMPSWLSSFSRKHA